MDASTAGAQTADGWAVDVDAVEDRFRELQDHICAFLQRAAHGQQLHEDAWAYDKGRGGGRTRVFEAGRGFGETPRTTGESRYALRPTTHPLPMWEKGACNFSGIEGAEMPPSAVEALKIPLHTSFRATGVSLIIHPSNPWVPTVHLNVRFFACGDVWWFGGGMDVTPYYPRLNQVVEFHRGLDALCTRHGMNYDTLKRRCDDYFFLPHRNETRGVGGLFYDRINDNFEANLAFTLDLGRSFTELYGIFLNNCHFSFTRAMREFQLYRRGRYVEFNLLYDRGTKFGLNSNGRTESILVSLPATVHWAYSYNPPAGDWEAYLYAHFLQAQDWLHLSEEQRRAMVPPRGYATGKQKTVFTEPCVPWHERVPIRLLGAAAAGAGVALGVARLFQGGGAATGSGPVARR